MTSEIDSFDHSLRGPSIRHEHDNMTIDLYCSNFQFSIFVFACIEALASLNLYLYFLFYEIPEAGSGSIS